MARCAIQHNGLFGKVAAVTALKLRLVRLPLRALAGLPNPRYVLRPLRPARVAHCSLRVATSHPPGSHWCVWSRLVPSPQGFWSGALPRSRWCWPPPTPAGPGAVASRPRRWVARPPPKGAPSTPALGCCVGGRRSAGSAVRRSRLACRIAAQPQHPSPQRVARVQQRCQAVKAAARRLVAVAHGQP